MLSVERILHLVGTQLGWDPLPFLRCALATGCMHGWGEIAYNQIVMVIGVYLGSYYVVVESRQINLWWGRRGIGRRHSDWLKERTKAD